MVYRLFRAFIGRESGRWCRVCGDPIAPRDAFGLGEGVCPSCR